MPLPQKVGWGLGSVIDMWGHWLYQYLRALRGREIPSSEGCWASADERGIEALVWDEQAVPMGPLTNRDYFGKPRAPGSAAAVQLKLQHLKPGRYQLRVHRTGYQANDAYTAWLQMGSPGTLDEATLARLHAQTRDLPEQDRTMTVGADGRAELTLPLRAHDVLRVSLRHG